jgi:hypothetical protein
MGREKRARLKRWSKNTWRTCRCSHHHESAYPRRSKSLQQTTNATLTTTEKESEWSCEGMHGMAIMMQCNLSNLSEIETPIHTYMVQVVLLLGRINCWLAWQRQGMGELCKNKWSGVTIFGNTQILHSYLLGVMQTTTSCHDARCKQIYRCHIQILQIFLIKIHMENILFWVTN